MSTYKAYTGIGSRETPDDIYQVMRDFAYMAANNGWTVRSGGADGADTAFELGSDDAGGNKEIFLPWKGFNKRTSDLYPPPDDAYLVGAEIHPAWQYLKEPARKLIARNMQQVLGTELITPTRFVICWTKDGCESFETYSQRTGGTGTALSLASLRDIPIFNLKNDGRFEEALLLINADD